MADPPPIPPNLQRLTIICPSWVGDIVMATPVFRAARAALPEATITALLRPGLEEILHGSPFFDHLEPCSMKGFSGPLHAGKVIKKHHPEAVLLLPNSFRAALTARFSSSPIRIGYKRDGRGFLLTHPLDIKISNIPTPAVEYYLHLARFAFGQKNLDPTLELHLTDHENQESARLLFTEDGVLGIDRPFILLNPGANREDKRWPAARFARIAEALHHRGYAIAITGSPPEKDLLDSIVNSSASPILNLAQRGLSLGSLKAVIKRAELLITNDTGPRHLAAALGTPTVVLFGPTDHRWTTLPHAREHLLLAEPFLPEDLAADFYPDLCTVDRITVGDVLAAAEKLLPAPVSSSP